MKKISLRNFLTIFFSLLALIIIIQVIYVFVLVDKSNKVRAIRNSYSDLQFSWTLVQHSQYHFMFKYKEDQVFFQTEQNKFIKRSQIYSIKMHNQLDTLSEDFTALNYDFGGSFLQLGGELSKLETIFEDIKHQLFLRGSSRTGVIGDNLSLYNLSTNFVADRRIRQLLLQSHLYFLDYLNNPNYDKYEEILGVFGQMNVYLKQQARKDTVNVLDSVSGPINNKYTSEFWVYVNEYKHSFGELVNIDNKLFYNDQSNLINRWIVLNQDYEELLSETQHQIKAITQETINEIQRRFFVLAILVFVFFAVLIFIIPVFVTKRIKELQTYIEPMKSGIIPDQGITPRAFTELIDISVSLTSLVESLKSASLFATEIGKRNFGFSYTPVSSRDELGNALILLRDNLSNAEKEETLRRNEDRIREWTNTGIAKFSDILRQSTKDLSELTLTIIKDLVNYLDANQGGVFVLNDENKDNVTINLAASYAYSKERRKQKMFHLGEGLIGTCAVEKATIYMTEIPEDYISITSGLGGATPRCLLIVPLKHEDNVLGVIEVASFNKLEKYQIKFVEQIAESIASTLSITKINEVTAKLLENARLEAEERILKEEELKHKLQELELLQEQSIYREKELESLIKLIDKVSYITELDLDGNIIVVPSSVITFLGLEQSQILGHHFSEFDSSEDTILKEDDFWQRLAEGKNQKYERFFTVNSREYWFSDIIIPYYNNVGQISKYICLSYDNTDKIKENMKLYKLVEKQKREQDEMANKLSELEVDILDANKDIQSLRKGEKVLKRTVEKNNRQLTKMNKLFQVSNQYYQYIFQKSSDAMLVLSKDKILDCNDATLKLLQYNKKEIINKSFIDISSNIQDNKNYSGSLEDAIKLAVTNNLHQFTWTFKRKDNSLFTANVILSTNPNKEQQLFVMMHEIIEK